MPVRGLNFREEVGVIVLSCRPDHLEDSLAHSVSDPVVAHIDGFGPAELDGVVCDSYGSAVVGIDLCGRLGIAEAREDGAFEVGMLGVEVERCIFGLGCGAADGGDGAAERKDSAIEDIGGVVAVAAVVEASSDGTCALLGEMGSVGDDLELHVAGSEDDLVRWVSGGVTEKHVCGGKNFLGRLRLPLGDEVRTGSMVASIMRA